MSCISRVLFSAGNGCSYQTEFKTTLALPQHLENGSSHRRHAAATENAGTGTEGPI